MAGTWEKGRQGLEGSPSPQEAWSPACFPRHLSSGIGRVGVLVITSGTAGRACAHVGEWV